MKTACAVIVIVLIFGLCTLASSALNVSDNMVYDDVNDITWLLDANYIVTSGEVDSPGYVTWDDATEWVSDLEFDNATGWRLPADADMTYGYINNGELGYLYYDNLGNVANELNFNAGVFTNVQRYGYWTSATATTDPNERWIFNFYHGSTDTISYKAARAVWPVHDGDVTPMMWQGEVTTWQGENMIW